MYKQQLRLRKKRTVVLKVSITSAQKTWRHDGCLWFDVIKDIDCITNYIRVSPPCLSTCTWIRPWCVSIQAAMLPWGTLAHGQPNDNMVTDKKNQALWTLSAWSAVFGCANHCPVVWCRLGRFVPTTQSFQNFNKLHLHKIVAISDHVVLHIKRIQIRGKNKCIWTCFLRLSVSYGCCFMSVTFFLWRTKTAFFFSNWERKTFGQVSAQEPWFTSGKLFRFNVQMQRQSGR